MSSNKFILKHLPSLVKATYKDWIEDEPFDLSSTVAYYSIFSLPALIVIIVSIAGIVFGQEAVQGKVAAEIGSMLGADAGKDIQGMVANAYKKGSSTLAAIIGIVTLLFGATGVFMALQKSLNKIWDVKPDPTKSGWKKLIKDRATSFGIILVIGFLLLVSLIVTTALSAISVWISARLPDVLLYVFYVINFIFSFGLITVLFATMFKFLPDVKIEWKSVWVGAVLTAFLFVLGKFGLGLYFGKAEPGSTYGAAGSVILVLLWVSYSCLIMFFGAEFTQVYAKKYGHNIEPSDTAVRADEKPDDNTKKASTDQNSEKKKKQDHFHRSAKKRDQTKGRDSELKKFIPEE